MNNFIHEINNCLDSDTCKKIIILFEKSPHLQKPGITSLGQNDEWKKSTEISLTPDFFVDEQWSDLLKLILTALSSGIEEYKKIYSNEDHTAGIDSLQPWRIDYIYNIQRYYPGEGYYVWHCENAGKSAANRVLAWMFYLNDVNDKGGTEFLFQNYTCKAEQGKLVIWPSQWTHYHRGEISPSETKYIITGWGSFI
jgi:hypothetical protein